MKQPFCNENVDAFLAYLKDQIFKVFPREPKSSVHLLSPRDPIQIFALDSVN